MIPKPIRTSIIVFAFVAVLLGRASMAGQHRGVAALSVSLSHARMNASSLSFDWRLLNSSSKPLYVYSTFLKGPAAVVPTNQSGLIKVRTSLRTAESVGVNAYPPPKFLRIEPGEILSGKFVESKLSRGVRKGANAVEMEVAFGTEIDELKEQISMTSRNGEHPANPIVAWQTEVLGETALEK